MSPRCKIMTVGPISLLASSQQSSIARTHSRISGLNDDGCELSRCKSEPPGKIESRALGRVDSRDCLGV